MKIIHKLKNYHPNKYICYLYFFIPIFIGFIVRMDKEADIFFLLRYGEQVVNHGFPVTDFLSMHQGFDFVMLYRACKNYEFGTTLEICCQDLSRDACCEGTAF